MRDRLGVMCQRISIKSSQKSSMRKQNARLKRATKLTVNIDPESFSYFNGIEHSRLIRSERFDFNQRPSSWIDFES